MDCINCLHDDAGHRNHDLLSVFEHSKLSELTSDGEWELSYSKERGDQYWNGYVSKKTSEDAELKRVVFL
ncbi:hypothetical protein PO124_12050 [Bacillus licheniformis]|nr:hypothetical protein [Bacillus licheniformis]